MVRLMQRRYGVDQRGPAHGRHDIETRVPAKRAVQEASYCRADHRGDGHCHGDESDHWSGIFPFVDIPYDGPAENHAGAAAESLENAAGYQPLDGPREGAQKAGKRIWPDPPEGSGGGRSGRKSDRT